MNLEDICLEKAKHYNGVLRNASSVTDPAKVVEVAIRPSNNQKQRIGYVFNSIDDAFKYLLAVNLANGKQSQAASLLVSIGKYGKGEEWPDPKYFSQPRSARVWQALTYLNLCKIRVMRDLNDFPDFDKFMEQIKKKEFDVNEGLPNIERNDEGQLFYVNNDVEKSLLSYAVGLKNYAAMQALLDQGANPALSDGIMTRKSDDGQPFFLESLNPTQEQLDRSNMAADTFSPIERVMNKDDVEGLKLILLHTKGKEVRRKCFALLLEKLDGQAQYDLLTEGLYKNQKIIETNELKNEIFTSLSESQLSEFLIKINEKRPPQELAEKVTLVMREEFRPQWGRVQSELSNIQRDNTGKESLSKKLNLLVLQLPETFVKLDRNGPRDVQYGDLFERGLQLAIIEKLYPSSPEFKKLFKEQAIDDIWFRSNKKTFSEKSKNFSMITSEENKRLCICGGRKENGLVIDSLEPTPAEFMLEIDKTIRDAINQYNQDKNDQSNSSSVVKLGIFHTSGAEDSGVSVDNLPNNRTDGVGPK